jgi:hypothetical protein
MTWRFSLRGRAVEAAWSCATPFVVLALLLYIAVATPLLFGGYLWDLLWRTLSNRSKRATQKGAESGS